MPKKIEYKKEYKELFGTSAKKPTLVTVPALKYLSVQGKGDPNTSKEFQDAFEALYGIVYTIKFLPKKEKAPKGFVDFTPAPPEAQWWVPGKKIKDMKNMSEWHWRLMIIVPDFVNQQLLKKVTKQVQEKKEVPSLSKVKLEKEKKGQAVQMLHIGSYATEEKTIEKMLEFMKEQKLKQRGRHHEIYLSDPNRTAKNKLKTIIRLYVTKK